MKTQNESADNKEPQPVQEETKDIITVLEEVIIDLAEAIVSSEKAKHRR